MMDLARYAVSLVTGLLCTIVALQVSAQCGANVVMNPGFENVTPPCGVVDNLINGSFNQGCMDGWEAAWGTPSVCEADPFVTPYYACFGANNEGMFQEIDLCQGGVYQLSFFYLNLNSQVGDLDVYMAAGLVNQPMSNSGSPPITIDPQWQLIISVPVLNNGWTQVITPPFTISDPANTQLFFLNVPVTNLDVGVDDVVLNLVPVQAQISCTQVDDNFTFTIDEQSIPAGFMYETVDWDFGDGNVASGNSVTHVFSVPGIYEVCYTATDSCGCMTSNCIEVDTEHCSCGCVDDMEAPVFLSPPVSLVEVGCVSDMPPIPDVMATDNCIDQLELIVQEDVTGDNCLMTIVRTWTASDACGNSATVSQTIVVRDDQPPVFTMLPSDMVVDCGPNTDEEFMLWTMNYGGAEAFDACATEIWNVQYDAIPEGCSTTTVTFEVSDLCGNNAVQQADFTIVPGASIQLITAAQNFVVICDTLNTGALDVWLDLHGYAEMGSACDSLTWSNNFTGNTQQDSVLVVFAATDGCATEQTSAWIIQQSTSDTTYTSEITCDQAAAGIDSTLVVNGICTLLAVLETVFIPSDTMYLQATTCDPLSAGIDTMVYSGQVCDSVVILTSLYVESDTTVVISTVCDSSLAGVDTSWHVNAGGCDSMVMLFFNYIPSDTVLITGSTCDWMDTVSSVIVLQNQFGCDSIIITEISSIQQDTIYETTTTCDSAMAGMEIYMLPGPLCDTILIIETVFLPASVSLDTVYSCLITDPVADTLILSGSGGCDSLVIMHQLPVALMYAISVDDETCAGANDGIIAASNLSGGMSPYTFQLIPGVTQTDSVFNNLAAGLYDMVVADANGCVDTTVSLDIEAGEIFIIDAGPDFVVSVGDYIELNAVANAQIQELMWTAFDSLSCDSCHAVTIGPVSVMQTIIVESLSQAGCAAVDSVQVVLLIEDAIYIPNSFSPNQDGINDKFSVFNTNPQNLNFAMTIFDRWGNMVYRESNLTFNDTTSGWDGANRGKPMSPGVFTYLIQYVDASGQQTRTGDITLIR
jgi:gliding motility-associated-like protein